MHYMIIAFLAETCLIYASILVKQISLDPILTAFYRVVFSIPFFFILASMQNSLKISLKDFWLMVLAGIFFGVDLVFFNLALHKTSVANVNLIASMVCFVLVPIGIIFFKETLNIRFILGSFIAIIGLIILLKWRGSESVSHYSGDILAFISMSCYAIFLALVYQLRQKYPAVVIMFYSVLGSSVVLFFTTFIIEGQPKIPLNLNTWLDLILIVLFGQILGQGVFSFVIGKISTQASSLILLLTPATAVVMGYFIAHENIGIFEIIGIAIILCGIYVTKQKGASKIE